MKREISSLLTLFISTISVFASQPIEYDSTVVKNVLLSEVAINGNKEPLPLKQLPSSVTVFTKKQLEDHRPQSLRDISFVTPNLYMPDYGSKITAPIYIRGIGSRINSPSVGLYVDQVPYMEKSAFDFDFFDVERIEVLRGPQGTLYGRNTMGGIILVQTRSPFETPGLVARATAGNYGLYDANVGWYDSCNDRFGYSLSLNYKHRDGYYRNEFLDAKVDKLDSWGARNKLIWKINPNLTVENIASFENSEQGGYPYAVYNSATNETMPINYDRYSFYNRKLFSDALVLRWHQEKFELTSNTSFQFLDDAQHIDQDFTVWDPTQAVKDQLDYYVVQKQRQNMVSQEVVIRSRGEGRYKWVAGVYGFLQGLDTNVAVDNFVAKTRSDKNNDITTYGGALFHQSFFKLFPKLTLGAGLRLDLERAELHYIQKSGAQPVQKLLKDTIYPTLDSHELMPRFSLTYQLDHGSIYAVAAKGYKTGGFNSVVERPEDLRFDSENSWNYELGYKFSAANGFLNGDVALFYIDWRNQQIYQTVPSGRGSMIKNAGHSRSRGFEVSLATKPVYGFDFQVGYGYTDAEFLKHDQKLIVKDALGKDHVIEYNFKGNAIPYAPKNTLMAQVNKNIDMKGFIGIDHLRMNVTYRGAGRINWREGKLHDFQVDGSIDEKLQDYIDKLKDNVSYQNYYGLVDASITAKIKTFKVSLWSRNILDESYHAFLFSALNRNYVQQGQPRSFGVTVEYQLPL